MNIVWKVIIAIQAIALVALGTSFYWQQVQVDLLKQNVSLQQQVIEKQEEIYTIRYKLGEAYKKTLYKLLVGYGLMNDKYATAAQMVLDIYDSDGDEAMIGSMPKQPNGGIGGGNE